MARAVIELFKATRIYRTLQILMAMMVPAAFADNISKEVFLLAFCCVLGYSIIGIHNAIKDKDYAVPRYSKSVMILLLFVLGLLSLLNYIVFLTVLAWMILGYVYNTASRFILFGDSTVLAITHYTLPCLSSALLLHLDNKLTLKLAFFMFITFWFLMQSKNLKDTKDDSKRGYATLTTQFARGREISVILVVIGFALMFSSIFLFGLSYRILPIFFIVIALQINAVTLIVQNRDHSAVKLIRLLMMLFLLGIIFDKSSAAKVIITPIFLFLFYLILLLTNSIAVEKYIPKEATG